ncbi:O-antigen ligase family protein [Baekduia sp. Peel2402]|uniref:O-antigen ligase family protein n=1 Tax=Baekduia sp. Peel2402 TaxID=3458296 RepID=UPI00403E9C00
MSSIVLIRLPLLVGHTQNIKLFTLVLVWWATASALGVPRLGAPRAGALAITVIYAGYIGTELVRGAQNGVYGSVSNAYQLAVLYVSLVVFAFVAINRARSERERERRLAAIAFAPAMYSLVNVLLWAGGAPTRAAEQPGGGSIALGDPASTLGAVGIHVGRVEFPLTNSINLFGVVAAGGLAAAGIMLVRHVPAVPRWMAALAVVASCAGLLLGDSRGSLIVAIAVILWFALSDRIRAASGVAALLPVLPLLLLTVLGMLAGTGLDTSLSRNGGDFATGTNRLYIWQGAWDTIKHPSLDAVWGWGAAGQITSGASSNYAYLFSGQADPTAAPTHSVVLQTLVDGGYVGLLLLVAAMAMTITGLVRFTRLHPRSMTGPVLGSVIAILLGGTTEVAPTYYAQEALVAVLLAAGAASGMATAYRVSRAATPEAVEEASGRERETGRSSIAVGARPVAPNT